MKTLRAVEVVVRRPGARGCPKWRELADALAWQIEIGRLAIGARLPSTRTLAQALGVSRTTTAAAYDELASQGYIRLRVGDGAYVGAPGDRDVAPFFARVGATGVTPDGGALVLINHGKRDRHR